MELFAHAGHHHGDESSLNGTILITVGIIALSAIVFLVLFLMRKNSRKNPAPDTTKE